MRNLILLLGVAVIVLAPAAGEAGLYYSGEPMGELPSQWRGFLRDHKTLRSIAIKAAPGKPVSAMRERYMTYAEKLEKLAKERKLTADEKADLGAIYVRLGEASKAVNTLREAQRENPKHFPIAANLGTAFQMLGDLKQATFALQDAIRLAPENLKKAEELHLKLVRLRSQKKGLSELEELFGVRWIGDDGSYLPGKMAQAQQDKLPDDAVAQMQQLALWLPGDGPVLWQLAEMANMHNDLSMAAAMMEGCITQFGMQSKDMLKKRQLTQDAVDARADKSEHDGLYSTFKSTSKQPLLIRMDEALLPAIKKDGVNVLPWMLISETTIDRKSRPVFSKYLQGLDGLSVTLTGYIQPMGGEQEMSMFMFIENPVGCWYCDMPESTEILFVEMPEGKTTLHTEVMVRITGKLALNMNDPEEFLYAIRDAKVVEID